MSLQLTDEHKHTKQKRGIISARADTSVSEPRGRRAAACASRLNLAIPVTDSRTGCHVTLYSLRDHFWMTLTLTYIVQVMMLTNLQQVSDFPRCLLKSY